MQQQNVTEQHNTTNYLKEKHCQRQRRTFTFIWNLGRSPTWASPPIACHGLMRFGNTPTRESQGGVQYRKPAKTPMFLASAAKLLGNGVDTHGAHGSWEHCPRTCPQSPSCYTIEKAMRGSVSSIATISSTIERAWWNQQSTALSAQMINLRFAAESAASQQAPPRKPFAGPLFGLLTDQFGLHHFVFVVVFMFMFMFMFVFVCACACACMCTSARACACAFSFIFIQFHFRCHCHCHCHCHGHSFSITHIHLYSLIMHS